MFRALDPISAAVNHEALKLAIHQQSDKEMVARLSALVGAPANIREMNELLNWLETQKDFMGYPVFADGRYENLVNALMHSLVGGAHIAMAIKEYMKAKGALPVIQVPKLQQAPVFIVVACIQGEWKIVPTSKPLSMSMEVRPVLDAMAKIPQYADCAAGVYIYYAVPPEFSSRPVNRLTAAPLAVKIAQDGDQFRIVGAPITTRSDSAWCVENNEHTDKGLYVLHWEHIPRK